MSLFLQRTFDSLSNGSAYAALAVAISMVFRGTGVLNLAQGQMAMFSTYIALLFATVMVAPWMFAVDEVIEVSTSVTNCDSPPVAGGPSPGAAVAASTRSSTCRCCSPGPASRT